MMANFPLRSFFREFLLILCLYMGFRILLFVLTSEKEFSLEIFFYEMLGIGVVFALVLALFRVMKQKS